MSDTPRTDAMYKEFSTVWPNQELTFVYYAEQLERELSARPITPLQAAERAFIEAYRKYMNDAVDNETFNNLHDAMDDAWNHLQQQEQSNGKE